jgi:hypothetical protein
MTPNTTASIVRKHPARAGVFAVLGVIALGTAAGFALGYDMPSKVDAQVVLPPVTIVGPTLPNPIIVPVIPAVPVVPVIPTTPVPDVTVTGPRQDDTQTPPPADEGPTVLPEVVVVGNDDEDGEDDPFTPPCCTEQEPEPEPPVTDNPFTPPCCTEDTPDTTTVVPPTNPPVNPPNPPREDYCPNLPGYQADGELPDGYYVDDEGNCVPPPDNVPPQCIFLNGTPNVINRGDSVLLTWETKNATRVSLNQGIGRVSANGSMTVNPTGNTTYILTVANANGSVNCQTSVTVTSIEQGPQCVSLTASDRTIEKGESVTLEWVTNNADRVSIDQGIGNVTPVSRGTVTVRPDDDITYRATVNGNITDEDCVVSIDVDDDDGGGGGGGGGGGRRSARIGLESYVPDLEEPLSFVYLSETPYTGLELGTWGTALYWLMLIGWSGALAYLVLFNAVPFALSRAKSFGGSVKEALNSDTGSHGHDTHQAAHAPAQHAHVAHSSTHAAPAKPSGYNANEGFRSFQAGDGLTIDDIVKGLSRQMELSNDASEPAPVHQDVFEEKAAPAYVAPAAPKAAVAAPIAAPMNDSVRDFLKALLDGDRDTVFGMIRTKAREGEDTELFVSHAACALDDAYRACIDGTTCHPDIAELTNGCHPSFLEKLVASLSTAVDGSYSAGMTGVKMALTRALGVVAG